MTTSLHFGLAFILAVGPMLAACGDDGASTTPDAGSVDAGSDASVDVDAGGDEDAGPPADAGVDASEAPDCTEHADCTDPAAARCEEGACVPCAGDADCVGTGAATLCDLDRETATCVECTVENADACDASTHTCNLVTGACDAVAPGSVGECEACTNDAQCATDFRCIPMELAGVSRGTGGYCLQIPAPSCGKQHISQPITRASLNGEEGTYCGVSEARTTCEAVLALENDQTCEDDADCPETGLCRAVGVLPGLFCSYPCEPLATQCFAPSVDANKSSCGDGAAMDDMHYCGG